MKGKFIAYALAVSLVSTGGSWNKLLTSPSQGSSYSGSRSGSSWSSNTGSGSWGGSGGHK